jgi:hypothetical protein
VLESPNRVRGRSPVPRTARKWLGPASGTENLLERHVPTQLNNRSVVFYLTHGPVPCVHSLGRCVPDDSWSGDLRLPATDAFTPPRFCRSSGNCGTAVCG